MNTSTHVSHYRPEIDGLRALAVIAVVLYHSRISGFVGGFVGVDVFFAISGYVVTSTLWREHSRNGHINWLRFVVRRARRLLPLLWFTLLSSLALAYWLLPPFGEFQDFCKSAIASLGLSANLFFWQRGGSYFSPAMEQLPLMHIWSLAVEEQFYLMVPLVFLLIRWTWFGSINRLVAGLTLCSLALTLWGTHLHPIASFYLPMTRAWEFGAGMLVALLPPLRRVNPWYTAILLAGIVASFVVLDPESPFQPLEAGLPAVITALLIRNMVAGTPGMDFTRRCLGSAPLRWIGQRSYAWYLLHWPALVFYRSYQLEEVASAELLAVSVITLAFAAVVHEKIELPCRYARWPITQVPFKILCSIAVVSLILAVIFVMSGLQAIQRQPQAKWKPWQIRQDWVAEANSCLRNGFQTSDEATVCKSRGHSDNSSALFLWGDSHAYTLRSTLALLQGKLAFELRTWAMGGCPPLQKHYSTRDLSDQNSRSCATFITRFNEDLAKNTAKKAVVVISARWEYYLGTTPLSVVDISTHSRVFNNINVAEEQAQFTASLISTVKLLTEKNVQVILVAPIPEQRLPVPACLSKFENADRCQIERETFEEYRASAMKMLKAVMSQNPSVQVIDPVNTFCDAHNFYVAPAITYSTHFNAKSTK